MTSKVSRPLPHNIDAERAVLGALMLHNDAINDVVDIIRAEDFFQANHALIFITMQEIYEETQVFDVVTLVDRLKQKKKLEDVGGPSYLTSLVDAVPTAANVRYHAEIVAQKSLARQLLLLSNKVVHDCFEESEQIGEILDRAERNLFLLGERRIKSNVSHVGKIVLNNIDKLDQLYKNKALITGVPSGFDPLDKLTAGFQRSDMIIIAARPSVGKTSFTLNMAQYAALTANTPSLIFSLEMSKESLVNRILCSMAKVNSQNIRTGFVSKDELNALFTAAERLHSAPLYIDDTPGLNVLEMRAIARRLKGMHDIQIIFIDYLQLIKAVGRVESRQQEISQISGSLKSLAKELDIPVVVCSQLSRDVEKRHEKTPRLSDLRESGAIEQDADVIGFLYRVEDDEGLAINDRTTVVEFNLAKQRNGPQDKFRLIFFREYTLFRAARKTMRQQEGHEVEQYDAGVEDDVPFDRDL